MNVKISSMLLYPIIINIFCFICPFYGFAEDLVVWQGESVELMCPIPPKRHENYTVYSQYYGWQECPDGIELVQVGGTRHVKITITKFFTDVRTVKCKVSWYEKNGTFQYGPYSTTYSWNVSYYKVGAIPNQQTYNLKVGQGQRIGYEFTHKPSYPDAFVSFTSTDPNIATVDNDGNITGIAPGICEIILKTNYDVENTCKVNVIPIETETISLNTNNIELFPDNQFTLFATFQPANATDRTLTFTSSDTCVAEVSGHGVIIAKSVGNATITARASNGVTDFCNIKVNPIAVSQIKLESSNLNLYAGDSVRINATLIPENCTDKSISYQVVNPDLAIIQDGGKLTAIHSGSTFINIRAGEVEKRIALTIRDNPDEQCKIHLFDYSAVKINGSYQTFCNGSYATSVAKHSDYNLTVENVSDSWVTSLCEDINDYGVSDLNGIEYTNIVSDRDVYIVHKYHYDILEYDIIAGTDQIIDEGFYYRSDGNVLIFENLPENNIVSLYDLNGKLLYQNSRTVTEKSFSIPSPGIYIIEIKLPDGVKSYKLKL